MRGRFIRGTRWLVAIAAFLMVWTGEVAGGEETDHPARPHRPPAMGRWVGDHWTPYEPPDPETFGETGQAYRIVRDDTLWDLAGRFYSDPYLWPHIWDANRYILDSHWIYPGDPLLIPGRPTVVTEVLPKVEAPEPAPDLESGTDGSAGAAGPAPGPAAVAAPSAGDEPAPAPDRVAYADQTDLECLEYIVKRFRPSDLFIAAAEEPAKVGMATDDIVYLSEGERDGITPGAVFTIVHKQGQVSHPRNGNRIGDFVQQVGRLRVVSVQRDTSIAQIEFACTRLERGLDLIPYEPVASPVGEIPDFDYRNVTPSGNPDGYIVHAGGRISTGTGQFVQVSLGTEAGAEPGDFLAVFVDTPKPTPPPYHYSYTYDNQTYTSIHRELKGNRKFPRRIIGHGVVVAASPRTAVVKVLDSIREIEIGDRVELR